jgi:hypothetical protein
MKLQFLPTEDGPLKVFHKPEPDMVYTMGLDASTGLSEDFSCMQVVTNSIPFVQVATFRAKWPVNKVSEMADMVGRWYNTALIVCEVNYPGNSVQDALLQYYNYPRNYQPEQHLDEDPTVSVKFGFRTTETSKWMLIHSIQMLLTSREIRINDRETLYEMLNYIYQSSRNKTGAAQGFNDDTVMALMLAIHGAKLYPFLRPIVDKKEEQMKTKDPDAMRDWRMFRERLSRRNDPENQNTRGILL